MTIIYWTISWLTGIWLATTWEMPNLFWLTISLLAILGIVLLRRHPHWPVLLICIPAACLGAIRYNLAAPDINRAHIANHNGTNDITVTGIVAREPRFRDDGIDLYIDTDTRLQGDGTQTKTNGNILVRAARNPVIPYGARLQILGNLETPQNFGDFDYRQYLARQAVYSVMNRPDIEILETGLGNPALQFLLKIKDRAQKTINRLLPEPQAALLSGILLGNDSGLPDDLAQDFRATGTTHIIAISGFNIAIIAGILLLGSRHLVGYRTASYIALGGIAIYTIFVGADASVVRAAVMGAFLIIATQIMGRSTFLPATIFTAALIMTLINPFLLWDVGFQLSFAATLGLVLYVGTWSKRLEAGLQPHLTPNDAQRVTRTISDVVLATLAASLMTLPIILYHFGNLSLISPLANLFVLPAQPGVMLWGGLATMLGMLFPILGQVPAWIAWLFLSYTTSLVRFFASMPATTIPISLSFGGVLATYTLILGVTWLSSQDSQKKGKIIGRSKNTRLKRAAVTVITIAIILAGIGAWKRPDGKLHVTFLDVGQGDATFIQTPGGRQVLIDGGQYSSRLLDGLGAEMPFWDKAIDILVVTHPDKDHFLGLIGVLDRYQVGTLITNSQKADSPDYDALLNGARELQIPIHQAQAGEVIEMDSGVRLEILHPDSSDGLSEDNDNSISFRLVYQDFSLLLTGDAESKAEQKMLASGRPLQSLIYKAGHHGAKTSSSALFLDAVKPQYIVISAGEENTYGHPDQEMLDRAEAVGAAVLRTDEMGTIEIISDGQTLQWEMDS